jgi:hypothetical protein
VHCALLQLKTIKELVPQISFLVHLTLKVSSCRGRLPPHLDAMSSISPLQLIGEQHICQLGSLHHAVILSPWSMLTMRCPHVAQAWTATWKLTADGQDSTTQRSVLGVSRSSLGTGPRLGFPFCSRRLLDCRCCHSDESQTTH